MSFCLPWWRFCLAGALGEVCCAIRPARWKRGRPSPMPPPQAALPNPTVLAGNTSQVPTSFGFDDENTSLIVKPCNRQNVGTFYVIRNELHSDIQKGVWEK